MSILSISMETQHHPATDNPFSTLGRSIIIYAIVLLTTWGCQPGQPPSVPTPPVQTMSADGAWCWFQDPRAVYIGGEHNLTIAGWMTSEGALQVGTLDHNRGDTASITMKANWDINDHNTSSMLVLPDNRLAVFYARHNKQGLFVRKSTEPASIQAWEEEVAVSMEDRITYSHPVYLASEGRYFVFWRGPSWKPTLSTSTDLTTWTDSAILLQEEGKEDENVRPYLKVATDNDNTIHFAFTNGHPRNEPTNSIYYLQYRDGMFFNIKGDQVGSLNQLPVSITPDLLVYDGSKTDVRAWLWDIAEDAEGYPVVVYTRLPSEMDHRYHYARWNGSEWFDKEMTDAGPWFPQTPAGEDEREVHYSGGIALDHNNPSRVYLSSRRGTQFEIERWQTEDGGMSWDVSEITSGSNSLNVRPVVPRGYRGDQDLVLWMEGSYTHYTDYQTRIKLYQE